MNTKLRQSGTFNYGHVQPEVILEKIRNVDYFRSATQNLENKQMNHASYRAFDRDTLIYQVDFNWSDEKLDLSFSQVYNGKEGEENQFVMNRMKNYFDLCHILQGTERQTITRYHYELTRNNIVIREDNQETVDLDIALILLRPLSWPALQS